MKQAGTGPREDTMKSERTIGGFRLRMVKLKRLTLGIPTSVGPRILYLSHASRPEYNLLGVLPDAAVPVPGGSWRLFGGHRLWTSPEAMPRSYSADDRRVEVEVGRESIIICGNPEPENGVVKSITVEERTADSVEVVHSIRNIGRWPIRFACWALSVMRPGGFAVIPVQPRKVDEAGLLPDRQMTLWPYTRMEDVRFSCQEGFLFVRQRREVKEPFKIGALARPEWAAYWVGGLAFVKSFTELPGEYPDGDCSVEAYTNGAMLELETLSPLATVEPGETLHHTEVWTVLPVGRMEATSAGVRKKMGRFLDHRKSREW